MDQKWAGDVVAALSVVATTLLLKLVGDHVNAATVSQRENRDNIITVVVPEVIPARWWQHFLHNQSSLLLKGALLFKKGVIVTSVPYHLDQ